MKIYLTSSWVLTDEHSMAAKGKPVLVDLETWQVYHREDMIGSVSVLQVVSQAVKEKGGKNFLPDEIHFISRFKRGDHENQSLRAGHMGNIKQLTYEEKEFFKTARPTGAGTT